MESNNKTIINEVSVGPFIKGVFTGIKNFFKGASDDVAKYASAEMGKVVQRLTKSGTKNISLQTIRSSAEYKKSLSALGEDYALKTYKKSYKALTDAEKKIVVKETTKNLDNVITKELQVTAGNIGADIAGGLKGVKLVRNGQKTAQITKTIDSLNKTTKAQVQRLITQNAKLIGDGTKGANIVNKIKSGQITIIKNGQVYTTQTKNLANQPVKVFQINKKTLGTIAALGVTAAAVAYLIGQTYKDDTIVLVDENGNDVTDERISEWAPCIQELLKSKEAILGYTPSGIVRVILKNTQYPNGIAFYTNGRVSKLETKEMGNWKCKSGKAVVSESKKISFMSLLNEEIINNIDITWDSGKQDDGSTPVPDKPSGSIYTDCSSYDINTQNIEFGCKHPIVKEIQKCLGLEPKYQTGNFGPITMKALGGNLITKDVYEKIKANCGSTSDLSGNVTTSDVMNVSGQYTPQGLGKVDASRFDYLNNPSSENSTSNESPEEFYNRLYNEGLLTGDVADTVFSDGTRYPATKRIKYKGPELSPNQLSNLDRIIGGFNYTRIKQKVKGEDMKYVWLQNKKKRN